MIGRMSVRLLSVTISIGCLSARADDPSRTVMRSETALQEAARLADAAERCVKAEKFGEALPLYSRALAIRQNALGPDHADVAQTFKQLGSVYVFMGMAKEAGPLYERAIAIEEKCGGSKERELADTLESLAAVNCMLHRTPDAEALYRRALAIRERVQGTDDPDVAKTLDQLGLSLAIRGQYKESVACLIRALEIQRKRLGREHPDLAKTMSDTAAVAHALAMKSGTYRKQPDRTRFIDGLLQQSLAIREKTLGRDHVSVAETMNLLAVVYVYQKRYSEAEVVLRRALAILEPKYSETAQMARVIDSYVYVLRRNHLDFRAWREASVWAARAKSIRAAKPPDVIANRFGKSSELVAKDLTMPSDPEKP